MVNKRGVGLQAGEEDMPWISYELLQIEGLLCYSCPASTGQFARMMVAVVQDTRRHQNIPLQTSHLLR